MSFAGRLETLELSGTERVSRDWIAERVALVDYRRVEVDDQAGTVKLPRAGMKLGLGAIGKGYALDRAAARLRAIGVPSFMIIAGGNGIGFAIPIDLAKDIVAQLKTSGEVTRGWLGVTIQDLKEDLASYYDVEEGLGVLVTQVDPESLMFDGDGNVTAFTEDGRTLTGRTASTRVRAAMKSYDSDADGLPDPATERRVPLPKGDRFVVDTQRLWHVVVHNGDSPRYALITSFESGPALESWIDSQRTTANV